MGVYRGSVICCLLIGLAGCSRGPAAVSIPKWDPEGFATAVIERLDKNSDGQVNQQELAEAPGLAAGSRLIDKNGDGALGRDELVERFTKYRDSRVGLMPKEVRISYNGQPLAAAEVRFVPEFFLADVIESATGTTRGDGVVRPAIPAQQTALMRVGYYRVEVSSPNRKLPAKFNGQTTLGIEVSPFANEPGGDGTLELPLRDKQR